MAGYGAGIFRVTVERTRDSESAERDTIEQRFPANIGHPEFVETECCAYDQLYVS